MDDRPPLFWCASCRHPIRVLAGIVVHSGAVYCSDTCHTERTGS